MARALGLPVGTFLVCLGITLLWPDPPSLSARAAFAALPAGEHSCDSKAGRTLSSNGILRLYVRTSRATGTQGLFGCRYSTGTETRLRRSPLDEVPKIFGLAGSKLCWVDTTTAADGSMNGGVVYNSVNIWGGSGRRIWSAYNAGDRYSDVQFSRRGRFAAIANPSGRQDSAEQRSQVVIFDPLGTTDPVAGTAVRRTIAQTVAGGVSDLAAAGDKLYWTESDGVHSAPFAEPSK